jgi:hypothetical protein
VSADTILERLAELSKLIEAHGAAQFILEQERLALYAQLRASGWKPPEVKQ